MKFNKQKITTPDGRPLMLYNYEPTADDEERGVSFSLLVNGEGLRLDGRSPYIRTLEDLDSFAKAIGDAMQEYDRMRVKIIKSIGGH